MAADGGLCGFERMVLCMCYDCVGIVVCVLWMLLLCSEGVVSDVSVGIVVCVCCGCCQCVVLLLC